MGAGHGGSYLFPKIRSEASLNVKFGVEKEELLGAG
jgi:hypothetical protein